MITYKEEEEEDVENEMMKRNLFLEIGWGELNYIGACIHGKKGADKSLARRNYYQGGIIGKFIIAIVDL